MLSTSYWSIFMSLGYSIFYIYPDGIFYVAFVGIFSWVIFKYSVAYNSDIEPSWYFPAICCNNIEIKMSGLGRGFKYYP